MCCFSNVSWCSDVVRAGGRRISVDHLFVRSRFRVMCGAVSET